MTGEPRGEECRIPFDVAVCEAILKKGGLAWRLHCVSTVDSTNRLAADLAKKGAPEGTVVLADSQLAGRGRLGRHWHSPPGRNVYLSVILRPRIEEERIPLLAMVAGVAAAEAIGELCPGGVRLKWPNDVLISGRKVCGILAQAAGRGKPMPIVVGVGLNVNMRGEDFPDELRDTATSLMIAAGRLVPREEAAALLLLKLARWYNLLLAEGFAPVRKGWLAGAALLGEAVRVLFGQEVLEGKAVGIDESGALLLEAPGGIRRILAGDATVIKEVK